MSASMEHEGLPATKPTTGVMLEVAGRKHLKSSVSIDVFPHLFVLLKGLYS